MAKITSIIRTIRGQRVILDADLAAIYGASTKRLNEQVRRNSRRFPQDFVFKLNSAEFKILRPQFATSTLHGGLRYLPYAFTEHGAIMAANVLNSPRAEEMSVFVVRAFVRLRGVLAAHKELADQLAKLEDRVGTHDQQIQAVFEAIRQLMTPPDPPRRRIGFHAETTPDEAEASRWKKGRPIRLKKGKSEGKSTTIAQMISEDREDRF